MSEIIQKLQEQMLSTEPLAAMKFDELVVKSGLWKVYTEVEGMLLHPRMGADYKEFLTIDRILTPTPALVMKGFKLGAVGVELKGSESKLGEPLAQAMDYSRCGWKLDNGFVTLVSWVFLFPFEKPSGPVASVMAQNRIGTAKWNTFRNTIMFQCPVMNIIEHDSGGIIYDGPKMPPCGRKVGSR